MHGSRCKERERAKSSYIEVRLIAIVSVAVFFLTLVLPALLHAIDPNGDNLDATWEAQYGITTNAYDASNLVGWWQLNGTNSTDQALDRSGNAINGSLSGFPTNAYGTGLFSNALYFTTNAVVNFPTTNSALNATNQFTFSAWFQSTNNLSLPTTIVNWSGAASNGWSVGAGTNGVANVTFYDGATAQVVTGTASPVDLYDGNWHQVAVTYTTNQVATVYVDGTGEATNTITGWTPGTVSAFTFGATNTSATNNPYALDETRLYNRALSPQEVTQLPVTYTDLNGSGLTVLQDYLEGLDPLTLDTIVTSGFLSSGLTSYYACQTPTLTKTGGDAQTVPASTYATNPLVVHVTNALGTSLVGAPITFTIAPGSDGGVSLASSGTLTTCLSLTTDLSGNATVYYQSGSEGLQNNTITATAVSSAGSVSVSFTEYCGVQSGLALWLKADAGVTYDGSLEVSSWIDQTGSFTVTQSGSTRPTYVPNDINGKPALRFNGSQWLYNSGSMATELNSDLTIITVGMTTAPTSQSYSFWAGQCTATGQNRGVGYYSGNELLDSDGISCQGAQAPWAGAFTAEAVTLDSSLTNVAFYQNGVSSSTVTISGLQNISSGMTVGAAGGGICGWQGDIAEVMVYDRKLSSTELVQVDGYLADKYGYYSPNATWPSAYSSDVQTQIAANSWNKSQANAYVALVASSPPVPVSGLSMWLKADSGTTTDTNGNISSWQDQSPYGNNAFQTSSSLRPQPDYNSLGGKPGVTFDGTGHFLRISDNSSLRPSGAMTRIVVLKPKSSNPYYSAIIDRPYQISSWSSAPFISTGLWLLPSSDLDTALSTTTAGQQSVVASPPIDSISGYVSMEVYDGSTQSFYINGTLNGSQSLTGTIDYNGSSPHDWSIGVSGPDDPLFYYLGDVSEVLFYNRALTSTELTEVDTYLANKYGLYDPNATWPSTYSSDVQAEITKHQWDKTQADNYVAMQNANTSMLTNGLTLWLKADDAGAINQDGSGNVSSWEDETGNYTVTQSGSTRPTYVASDVNGEPAIRFNGSQWLYNPGGVAPGLDSDMTIITVAKTTAPTSQAYSLYLGQCTTTSENRGFGYYSGNEILDTYGPYCGGGGAPGSGAFIMETVTLDSSLTNVTFYQNGVTSGTATISGVQNISSGITVGAAGGGICGWQGDIAEVLVYDHKLTSTELQQVSLYIATKYGLPCYGFAAPTVSPAAGVYTGSVSLALAGASSPATIRYTLDGTEPTNSSPAYTGTITLTGSALLQAAIFFDNQAASPLLSAQYYVNDSSETGLPTTPTGLTTTVVSNSEIDLAWSLSGEANYSGIAVYRSSDGGTTYQLVAVLDPSATSYDDTNVVAGTSYQYYVGTVNSSGQSDTSATSSVSPTASTTLSITVTTPSGATPLP